METLQNALQKDFSKKTKAELIQFLSGLENLLTSDVYQLISGIEISELEKLTKDDIIGILENFKKNYDPKWEKALTSAAIDTLKIILGKSNAEIELFRLAGASDADFAAELGSIDFATIIGGPLDACVKAQSNASISTVSFINEVGFEGEGSSRKLRMAEFKYKKSSPNPKYTEGGSEPAIIQEDKEITVPFIALLNIPSFRIESCEVDFNVKLNSTYTKNVSSEFGINAGASGGFGPVKFKVDVSYKRSSSTGVKIEKEYSLGVKVKATNDEMPAGLEKVLGLLGQ